MGSARYLRVFKGPLGTKKDQHLLRGGEGGEIRTGRWS